MREYRRYSTLSNDRRRNGPALEMRFVGQRGRGSYWQERCVDVEEVAPDTSHQRLLSEWRTVDHKPATHPIFEPSSFRPVQVPAGDFQW